MNYSEYKKIVKENTIKEDRLKNAFISFLVGGLIGIFSQILVVFMHHCLKLNLNMSNNLMIVFWIFISSLLTALGIFDKLVEKTRCGLIIPITGFAHSIASSIIDYKKEGLITGIGPNCFKLAGSVILYGVISAVIFSLIKYLIGG